MKYVVFLIVTLLSSAIFAGQVSCGQARYASEPVIGSDHVLRIVILNECTVTNLTTASLQSLDTVFTPLADGHLRIISGPSDEVFDKLPSKRFEISVTSDGHNDQVTIRRRLHLATDGTSRYHYRDESTKITATGDSKYLREMDREMSLSVTKDGAAFRYMHVVAIAKPWFVPSGVFISEVKKDVSDDFNDTVQDLAEKIQKSL